MNEPVRIMIDLETMGSTPGSAIVSIGAVKFSVEHGIESEFYERVSLHSCMDCGLGLDVSTVKWWMGLPTDARTELLAEPRATLNDAIQRFHRWLESKTAEMDVEIWAHGPDFDCVIFEAAHRAIGRALPVGWHYRNFRCLRSLRKAFTHVEWPKPPEQEQHHALTDAKRQAEHAIRLLQHIERLRRHDAAMESRSLLLNDDMLP